MYRYCTENVTVYITYLDHPTSVGRELDSSPLQGRQPLLDFERFYTQRDSAAPFREQAVSEDAVIAFYCGVRLWVDRF